MADSDRLLEIIEEGIVGHGGDLGGWTHRVDDQLQLFDGRVTLRAEMNADSSRGDSTAVHAHVLATLHEYDDEVLDACVFGIGDDVEAATGQAAVLWVAGVAGPIKSFLDNKPICMTCQAGVAGGDASQGFSPGDYGLPGVRAYVGPSFSRGFQDGVAESALDGTKPWFRFAAESAAPRRVHLAKATVISKGTEVWSRELEIDGHEVSHQDPDWPAGVPGPEFGYLTRFAVFEFPRNSAEICRRAELERTIRCFAENYNRHESVDQLMQSMVQQGFDPALVHEVESISTIAFGRLLFEHLGINYPSTIIRARRDGRIETDVPLMSLPAYSRARVLGAKLRETMNKEDFQSLGLYTAESKGILQAMESTDGKIDLTQAKLYPCIVPDAGVSDETMDSALTLLYSMAESTRRSRKKPWWKFW